MEQTNLVVTPDGKTWDEVTRDVSYIGSSCIMTTTDSTNSSASDATSMTQWRGTISGRTSYNKDFAIAYDRMICLKDGTYSIHAHTIRQANGQHIVIAVNGTQIANAHGQSEAHDTPTVTIEVILKRGDYVQCKARWYGSTTWSWFSISRMGK